MQLRRTSNTHTDFKALTHLLDAELALRYGVVQKQYDEHNVIEPIDTALVGYDEHNTPPLPVAVLKSLRLIRLKSSVCL